MNTSPAKEIRENSTNTRLAFAIAASADVVQLPLFLGMFGIVTAPAFHAAIVAVDILTMVALIVVLGFHWLLLPSFFFEALIGFDLLPTWTGCVAYVVWSRRRQAAQLLPATVSTPSTVTDITVETRFHKPAVIETNNNSKTK